MWSEEWSWGDERQRMRKVAKDMDGAMLAGMGVVCRLSGYAPGGKRSSRLRLCCLVRYHTMLYSCSFAMLEIAGLLGQLSLIRVSEFLAFCSLESVKCVHEQAKWLYIQAK